MTIKMVDTFRYRVELVKQPDDTYKVTYKVKIMDLESSSETLKDYNFATFLFDLKVDELEGN